MKRILILFAAGLLVMTAESCTKKGENDPFLSFKTRDARITGVWQLQSSTSTYEDITTGVFPSQSKTETIVADGVRTSTTWTDYVWSGDYGENYDSNMEIKKNGTYATDLESSPLLGGPTSKSHTEGYWWWLNDKKKKTRIAFDDDAGSMDIDRLKNKEMVVTVNTTDTYDDGAGTLQTSTVVTTATFVKI